MILLVLELWECFKQLRYVFFIKETQPGFGQTRIWNVLQNWAQFSNPGLGNSWYKTKNNAQRYNIAKKTCMQTIDYAET